MADKSEKTGSMRFLKMTLLVFAIVIIGLGAYALLSGELFLEMDYGGFDN